MKILIIKRDKIGDMLLTTPMIKNLRKALPDAQIHLLANDYNAWVVKNNADIDKLWVYRRVKVGKTLHPGAIFSQLWLEIQLRRQHYDIAIVAGGDESSRAIQRALRIRAKRTIAFSNDKSAMRLTDALSPPQGMHEVDRMHSLLRPLGIVPSTDENFPAFILPEEAESFAKIWLSQQQLAPEKYVVLGLGARRAKKQPTTEQILRWTEYFKSKWKLDTVFMWTPGSSDNPLYPGDDETAQPVLDSHVPYIYPFRGALQPALGLIWHARASIFPDSGLMHFAAASPGGVLGLFADTEVSPNPLQWGPRGVRADYLEADRSVSELSDAIVYERLEALLKTSDFDKETGSL